MLKMDNKLYEMEMVRSAVLMLLELGSVAVGLFRQHYQLSQSAHLRFDSSSGRRTAAPDPIL